MKTNKLLLIALLVALATVSHAERILIQAGRLIDVKAGSSLSQQTLIVEGDRITAVSRGYLNPIAGDVVIDLKNATVMPGWLDMHVHLTSQLSPKSYEERFQLSAPDMAFRAALYAKRTLMAGFTTVRDLGASDGVSIALRKAIDGTRDAWKAVRARYKEGADLIKITATGGVLSQAKNGLNPQFTLAEIKAIVAAAKDYGFKVAAHAHGTEGMRRAVIGGVDSIEHGTFMTDEIMKLMKKKGTWYVPTISAGEFVAEKARQPGYFSDLVRPKAAAIGPQIRDTFTRAYKAGVKIAFGTDTGVSPHGENWKEFTYMVAAGMPAMQAIQAATRNAAELLGQSRQLGSLEAGKLADVVAVSGDPLQDIHVMGKVMFVMKAGVVYKH